MRPVIKRAHIVPGDFTLDLQLASDKGAVAAALTVTASMAATTPDAGALADHPLADAAPRRAAESRPLPLPGSGMRLLRDSDVRDLLEAARREAFAAGHAAGLEEGRAAQYQLQHQAEFEAGHDAGYETGFDAGAAAGMRKAEEDSHAALADIAALLRELDGLHAALLEEMKDTAAEVVFEALVKILGRAAADHSLALAVTLEAVERAGKRANLVLRVAARDADIVQQALLAASATLPACAQVVADASVCGGCLVESAAGTLDARLETQLQALKKILLDARSENDAAQP